MRELSDRVAASQVVTTVHGQPATLAAGEIAVWISAVADYAERVQAAHEEWVEAQPKKGRTTAADCPGCRKARWRKQQKAREAKRAEAAK